MKKIINLLKRVADDKWAHFIVCLLIVTTIGFWDILTFHREHIVSAIAGFIIAVLFGLSKEIRDGYFMKNNVFSWGDFLADVIGAVVGFLLVLVLG